LVHINAHLRCQQIGAGKEVFIHFGAVSSAMYVWVNEEKVGYSQDSKTPAEFNITKYLKSGENSIAVEVYKWCDGTYLEDQDFWRLTGLTRDVFLMARNSVHIRDFSILSGLSDDYTTGEFSLNVELNDLTNNNYVVEAVLMDGTTELDSFTGNAVDGVVTFTSQYNDVNKWTAETPQFI
jgi:beta-galactosidase